MIPKTQVPSRYSLLDFGFMDYEQCWTIQKELVKQRFENSIPDTVILVEHPHVYTVGVRGQQTVNVQRSNIPTYYVERGGGITYHGPGQLVCYLIFNLEKLDLNVREFVEKICNIIITSLSDFALKGVYNPKYPGVWINEKKIASIGLALNQGITYHGFALNVNTELHFFKNINPCGLTGDVMTSMEKLVGEKVDMRDVKKSIIKWIYRIL
mgnify:CR=1 FL=1